MPKRFTGSVPRSYAPFGARCFLTCKLQGKTYIHEKESLNAPFGARCFLTEYAFVPEGALANVLMHLLALGAF